MSESSPLLAKESEFARGNSAMSRSFEIRGQRFPQAIAHRGYKAAYPENSMGAFKGAVEVGAHALETDVHLSRDGVVVISHDATLKRCFGLDKKIIDCDWDYLKTLRTIQEPQQSMPRLKDLLEYMTSPGLENLWVLLDIKLDDDPVELMRLIASTIAEVPPSTPWNHRVVLGCWSAQYVALAQEYLPDFPIAHIGISLDYARQFFKVPNVGFNIFQKVLVGPRGKKFLRDARAAHRPVYVWTVNEVDNMIWSIQAGVDGVISDDPKLYLDLCDKWDNTKIPQRSLWSWISIIAWTIAAKLFHTFVVTPRRKKIEAKILDRRLNKPLEA